jgi:radical SAM protein with 4Fe4S-binding SPASM domain
MGGLFLIISGGEAMLHPHFMEILRHAKKMDLAVTILSNLTLLTDEIIAELKEPSLSIVQASLYSMIPKIHDSITRIPGSFKKTYDGIMRLKDNNIPIKLGCTLMKQNSDTYRDVYQFGLDNDFPTGLDYLMSARSDHTTVNLENRLPAEDMREAIRYLIENDYLHQERISTRVFDEDKIDRAAIGNELICNACFNSMAITAMGDAIPCAMWYEYQLGNIKRIPLSEIWYNSDKIKSLRGIRKKNFPRCMSCEHINYCVLCMSKFANESPCGDHFAVTESTCQAAAFYREAALNFRKKQANRIGAGVTSKA